MRACQAGSGEQRAGVGMCERQEIGGWEGDLSSYLPLTPHIPLPPALHSAPVLHLKTDRVVVCCIRMQPDPRSGTHLINSHTTPLSTPVPRV